MTVGCGYSCGLFLSLTLGGGNSLLFTFAVGITPAQVGVTRKGLFEKKLGKGTEFPLIPIGPQDKRDFLV